MKLSDFTSDFPALELFMGDEALYRSFRAHESSLVSIHDKSSPGPQDSHEVIALSLRGHPAGMVSVITAFNEHRPEPRRYYARIDLVIVDAAYRKLGVAKALVVASLCYVLATRQLKLYSLSCLAAHPAIGRILLSLGFIEKRKEELFVLLEKNVEHGDVDGWQKELEARSKELLQVVNYRLRQGHNQ